MKKILVILAIGFAIWHFYLKGPESPVITNIGSDGRVLSNPVVHQPSPSFLDKVTAFFPSSGTQSITRVESKYRCDGRTHCSQMTSCDEAKFFLRNCPGVKMDGNNDGVPCEIQHCR